MEAAFELMAKEIKGNVVAVRTGLYWDKPLEAIADKMGKVKNMSRQLRIKAKGQPNEDGKMTPQQQKEYLKEYRAKIITPKEPTWSDYENKVYKNYLTSGVKL